MDPGFWVPILVTQGPSEAHANMVFQRAHLELHQYYTHRLHLCVAILRGSRYILQADISVPEASGNKNGKIQIMVFRSCDAAIE